MVDRPDLDKPIEGHEYDGIQELNNPLPKWWLTTFYGTIIFALIYFGYHQIYDPKGQYDHLADNLQSVLTLQEESRIDVGDIHVDVAALSSDAGAMATALEHFTSKCAVCHGNAGEGLVGPNLTDKFWIHGRGEARDIVAAIINGFPDKGMPPWGNLIPKEEHAALAAYVVGLQGSEPANAKDPEGNFINN